MLRIEEQFVHGTDLVDGDAVGPARQMIEILKSVLCPKTNVVETNYAASITVDHRLLETRKLGVHEGIEHGAFGTWKWNISIWHTLGRHLNNRHMPVTLPGFLLRQANPAYLIGR